jgi:hypothetical protein
MHGCEAVDGVPTTRAINIEIAITAAGIGSLRITDTAVSSAEVPLLIRPTG